MSSRSPPQVRPSPTTTTNIRIYNLFWNYWCYPCQLLFRSYTQNPLQLICPGCGYQLVTIHEWRRRVVVEYTDDVPPSVSRLLEGLSPLRVRNPEFHHSWEQTCPLPHISTEGRDVNQEMEDPPPPDQSQSTPRSTSPALNHHRPALLIPLGHDPRDFMIGPEIDDVADVLAQNARQGLPPLPALESTIATVPTVTATTEHLEMNEMIPCPVCQQDFMVEQRVKKMPCMHLFHEECIVLWLRMHNSCPVCRYKLPICWTVNLGDRDKNRGAEQQSQGGGSRTGGIDTFELN